jgi:alkylation response protein AidB-like acyl-CoA dehydrogenase
MDFDDNEEEAAFRAKARSWIDAHAPKYLEPELRAASLGRTVLANRDTRALAKDWQRKKYDAGWSCLHWPKEYGGQALSPIERVIWQQEEGVYSKLGGYFTIGQGICGPAIMALASEEHKRRFLPKIASGEETWFQLFSEPSAGSDLAGVRTRAVRDGDDWVINGQKIWITDAVDSDFGMLLARTDPTLPKHKGLTMFFLPAATPGMEIRPIKQMNGKSEFNEVFFTDVRIPDAHRVGAVGEGWKATTTTLMNERLTIGTGIMTGFPELFDFVKNLDLPGGPAIEDRGVRARLANWAVKASGLKYTTFRNITALSKGETPGPQAVVSKLVAGLTMQDIAMYAMDLQGEAGILSSPDNAADTARFQTMLMRVPGVRIGGGTDEIMRNIIAERALGLPPDIRVDKNVPFNEIPTSGARS